MERIEKRGKKDSKQKRVETGDTRGKGEETKAKAKDEQLFTGERRSEREPRAVDPGIGQEAKKTDAERKWRIETTDTDSSAESGKPDLCGGPFDGKCV